jgi:Uma2 family endonuclease
MAMPDSARRYTVDEVLAFPSDGNRYELVGGALLVTPAPRRVHQRVVGRLHHTLFGYLQDSREMAEVLMSPADITWGSDDDLVQPDIFVVALDQVDGSTDRWDSIRMLLLAVEVISPSSTRYDRVTKRRLYQRRGVATYWVVDPDARLVEVWRPEDERPEIVTDVLRWRVAPGAEELEIAIEDLFRDLPFASA